MENEPVNCEVCGIECLSSELETIKMASFKLSLQICPECLSKSPLEKYQEAANTLLDIKRLALDKSNSPDQRLAKIKMLLK